MAAALSARLDAAAVAAAETALRRLRDHPLTALYPQRFRAAQVAVRLLR